MLNDQVANGTKSLKVSGRNNFWNGTQLNLTKTISAGKTYQFTVSVKLNKGEKPDEVKMTMQGGDLKYVEIAPATKVTDGE